MKICYDMFVRSFGHIKSNVYLQINQFWLKQTTREIIMPAKCTTINISQNKLLLKTCLLTTTALVSLQLMTHEAQAICSLPVYNDDDEIVIDIMNIYNSYYYYYWYSFFCLYRYYYYYIIIIIIINIAIIHIMNIANISLVIWIMNIVLCL